MYSLLLLDDDENVLKSLSRLLRSEGYAVSQFSDPKEALIQCTARKFDLIISDQRMPGMDGTEFFSRIAPLHPHSRRVLISGYSDFEAVTDAFNDNIIHRFVVKPWDNDQLKTLIAEQLSEYKEGEESEPETKIEPNSLVPEKASLRPNDDISFHGIVTSDPLVHQQIEIIKRAASSEAPFFINGETGTGKELIARAIHLESDRSAQPFVALNCANLTESLLESQLFGHRKGAFTGADKDQKGLLAEADKGTLFLDEVTEIPLALQAKLLRVLQEREYSPLGETKGIPFDVKIISASSLSLEQAVIDGKFREDLRYRLEVMPINLPPLRVRGEDKSILFDYFLQNQLSRHGRKEMQIDEKVYLCVDAYHWPGNVRELVNVCTYVAALASDEDDKVSIDKLPPALRSATSLRPVPEANSAVEAQVQVTKKPALNKESLQLAITQFNGHRESIASHFGISRMTLWRRMKEFGLA